MNFGFKIEVDGGFQLYYFVYRTLILKSRNINILLL